jgi:hypothetical protein
MKIPKNTDVFKELRGFLALAVLFLALGNRSTTGAIRTVTTLAATNLPAPGFGPGVQFGSFTSPTIDEAFNGPAFNQSEQTTFYSTISGPGITSANDLVLWSSGSGTLHPVAQEGSQAPGTPAGVTFQSFGFPLISSTGETAFMAALAGAGVTSANNQGIWLERNGQLQLVAREGSQALGVAAGVNYASFSDLSLTSGGRVAFIGRQLIGPGITTSNDGGIWADRGNGLQLAVREGNAAPGLPAGTVFGPFGFQGLSFGGNANLAFHSDVAGPGITTANDFGVWSQTASGTLNLVAREGNQAPGLPAGVVWQGVSISDPFQTPGTNSNGDVAFIGQVVGGGIASTFNGAWSTVGGLHLLAAEGFPIPGLPGIFASHFPSTEGNLQTPINTHGDVAFRLAIKSTAPGTSSTEAVVAIRNGVPQVVAREGDTNPDLPGQPFRSFNDLVMLNGAGRVAFRADGNLWAQDRSGALRLIVAPGDQLQIGPGDLRTVSLALLITGSGDDDGGRDSFIDNGKLAYYAKFSDGTDGMFVSDIATVPEPPGIALLELGSVMSCLLLMKTRRERHVPCPRRGRGHGVNESRLIAGDGREPFFVKC